MTKRKSQPTPTPLADLRASNLEKADQLAKLGRALHPISLLQAHLTVLVEGLGFGFELEQEFEQLLDASLADATRSKLTEGIHLMRENDK